MSVVLRLCFAIGVVAFVISASPILHELREGLEVSKFQSNNLHHMNDEPVPDAAEPVPDAAEPTIEKDVETTPPSIESDSQEVAKTTTIKAGKPGKQGKQDEATTTAAPAPSTTTVASHSSFTSPNKMSLALIIVLIIMKMFPFY